LPRLASVGESGTTPDGPWSGVRSRFHGDRRPGRATAGPETDVETDTSAPSRRHRTNASAREPAAAALINSDIGTCRIPSRRGVFCQAVSALQDDPLSIIRPAVNDREIIDKSNDFTAGLRSRNLYRQNPIVLEIIRTRRNSLNYGYVVYTSGSLHIGQSSSFSTRCLTVT